MNFDDLHWLIFAGAPLLVIPEKSKHKWHGNKAPYDEKIDREIDSTDIEEINGKKYVLIDPLDFDNPRTHYEQICRIHSERPYLVFRVDDVDCLVFYSWGDGFAWWEEEKILFNGTYDLSELIDINWIEPIEYIIQDSELIFMNSAYHGADPYLDEDDYQIVKLSPGKYKIEKAAGEFVRIFKFTKID